jgi:hypothetical protein
MLDSQHSFSAWDLPKLDRFGQLHTFGEGKHVGKTWLQAVIDDRGFTHFIDKVAQDPAGSIWWDFLPWAKAWICASPEPAPKELPTTIPDIDTMTIAEPAPGDRRNWQPKAGEIKRGDVVFLSFISSSKEDPTNKHHVHEAMDFL